MKANPRCFKYSHKFRHESACTIKAGFQCGVFKFAYYLFIKRYPEKESNSYFFFQSLSDNPFG